MRTQKKRNKKKLTNEKCRLLLKKNVCFNQSIRSIFMVIIRYDHLSLMTMIMMMEKARLLMMTNDDDGFCQNLLITQTSNTQTTKYDTIICGQFDH